MKQIALIFILFTILITSATHKVNERGDRDLYATIDSLISTGNYFTARQIYGHTFYIPEHWNLGWCILCNKRPILCPVGRTGIGEAFWRRIPGIQKKCTTLDTKIEAMETGIRQFSGFDT